MGSASSVDNKPRSPYHRLCEAQIRKAKTTRYTDGEESDFYSHCSNGDTDRIRQVLEASDRLSIDELVKLECNGDTALHVAAKKGHNEIVKLLFEHGCSRIILNRSGKVASEEASTPDMQKLFIRSEVSDRFHDSDTTKTVSHYLPRNKGTNATENEATTAGNRTLEFFKHFETEEEVYEHSLNYQTTAMWVKFFNWLCRTCPSLLRRDNLDLDSFQLHKNRDFNDFLKEKLGDKYSDTIKAFNKAHEKNSIEPFLTIYSQEKCGFYRSLNEQLASSPAEAETSPHLCDRFIIEFHIRGDELEKRSFLGTTYRGATINSNEVLLYEKVCNSKPRGVITFKAFTSTSEVKTVALSFITNGSTENHRTAVLFVIEVKSKSPTIVGIADVSDFKREKEILIMPGNLFIVKNIKKDVTHTTDKDKSVTVTEIHLEYLHIPVSFWKKVAHTYQSANNSVTT